MRVLHKEYQRIDRDRLGKEIHFHDLRPGEVATDNRTWLWMKDGDDLLEIHQGSDHKFVSRNGRVHGYKIRDYFKRSPDSKRVITIVRIHMEVPNYLL